MSEIKEEVVIEKAIDSKDAHAKTLGAVGKIEVDGFKLYFKEPNRYALGAYFTTINVNKVQACEHLLKSCYLADISDKNILTDDKLFYSAMFVIIDYVDTIELKKSNFTLL